MVAKVNLPRWQRAVVNPLSVGRLSGLGNDVLPSLAGVVAVIAGATVLTGWVADNDRLKSLLLGADEVKANAALGLILLGAGLGQLDRRQERKWLGTVLVLSAVIIGAITSLEYLTGLDLRIDQAIFADPRTVGEVGDPGRMSPLTAICLVLLGASAIAARWRPVRGLVVGSVTVALSLAALNVLNLFFGGEPPTFFAGYTRMAPATAVVMLALAVGVIVLLGRSGPLAMLEGSSTASAQARRMLLAAVVLPFVLVWLRVRGEELGLYDSRFGASLLLVAMILSLAAVIFTAASAGRRLEHEREMAQAERDRFFDLSLDMLATAGADGRFIRLNPAWETTLGYPREELIAKPYLEFIHPDDRQATLYEMHRQFAEGKTVLHFQNRYRHRDGSYRWLEWTSQPVADGSVVYAVARDVTVRKLEEERNTKTCRIPGCAQ